MVTVDWEALPTERDPSKKEYKSYKGYSDVWAKGYEYDYNSGAITPESKETAEPADIIERTLIEALTEAIEYGYMNPLRDLLSEWANPEHPKMYLSMINLSLLSANKMARYRNQLKMGWYDTDSLLDELLTHATAS